MIFLHVIFFFTQLIILSWFLNIIRLFSRVILYIIHLSSVIFFTRFVSSFKMWSYMWLIIFMRFLHDLFIFKCICECLHIILSCDSFPTWLIYFYTWLIYFMWFSCMCFNFHVIYVYIFIHVHRHKVQFYWCDFSPMNNSNNNEFLNNLNLIYCSHEVRCVISGHNIVNRSFIC